MTSPTSSQTLGIYNAHITQGQANTATLLHSMGNTLGSNGQQFSISSDVHYIQNKALRYNVSTLFDLYSPHIALNTANYVLQATNLTHQIDNYQSTTINSSRRAENVDILFANNHYSYIGSQYIVAVPTQISHSAQNNTYADNFKLQVGQVSGVSASNKVSLGTKYGKLDMGATQDITMASQFGGLNLSVATNLVLSAGESVAIDAGLSLAITSKAGALVHTEGDLSLTGAAVISSATTAMSLSAKSIMTISGGNIFLNMGHSMKPSINLDTMYADLNPQTGGNLTALDSAGFSGLSTTLGNFSTGDISLVSNSALDQAIAQGAVPAGTSLAQFQSALSGALSISSGNFSSLISSNLASGISPTALAGVVSTLGIAQGVSLHDYGAFINTVTSSVTQAANLAIGAPTLARNGYSFAVMPVLSTLPLYPTTQVRNPTQGSNASGSDIPSNLPTPTATP